MKSLLNRGLVFCFVTLPLISMGQAFKMEASVRANTLVIMEHHQQDLTRRLARLPAGFSASVSYNVNPYLNVGVMYGKSLLSGTQAFHEGENYSQFYQADVSNTDFDYLMYGATARISTNIDKKLSVYTTGKFMHMELLEEFPDFSLISKGQALAAGIGLNFKITQHVNFNVFEFSYMWLAKDFNIYNEINENALFLQSGVSVKIFKKIPGAKW